MDYSKFVAAVLENDGESLKEYYSVITKVLVKFLLVRLDANIEDAKDSAQNAIMFGVEKIKNNELKHPDYIINYLFTTAKHDYLKHQSKQKESNYDEVPEDYSEEGDQLKNLLEEEKQRMLKLCFSKLSPKNLAYISYWYENPGSDAALVADHFGISVNNAWTKKHRIVQILKECIEKNINK
jgi:DNA-directed RNA polymerase specialized sigma24 family protein